MDTPQMRAGDADRERYVEQLRHAHSEGRLDLEELQTRVDRAYAARTFGELDQLVSDLPAELVAEPPRPDRPSPSTSPARRHRRQSGLRASWSAWAMVSGISVMIWALVSLSADQAAYFWPMWVAGPWGAVLLVLTLTGAGDRDRRAGRGS
jgi:Flp pilus assembly protein TadB